MFLCIVYIVKYIYTHTQLIIWIWVRDRLKIQFDLLLWLFLNIRSFDWQWSVSCFIVKWNHSSKNLLPSTFAISRCRNSRSISHVCYPCDNRVCTYIHTHTHANTQKRILPRRHETTIYEERITIVGQNVGVGCIAHCPFSICVCVVFPNLCLCDGRNKPNIPLQS